MRRLKRYSLMLFIRCWTPRWCPWYQWVKREMLKAAYRLDENNGKGIEAHNTLFYCRDWTE
jgi:hypothetical protein